MQGRKWKDYKSLGRLFSDSKMSRFCKKINIFLHDIEMVWSFVMAFVFIGLLLMATGCVKQNTNLELANKDEQIKSLERQADQCKKAYVELLNKDKDFSYLVEK